MFLANLNVLAAYLGLLFVLARIPLTIFVALALGPWVSTPFVPEVLANSIVYLLLALIALILWWRNGRSPAKRKRERERHYRIGHALIASMTVLALAALVAMYLSKKSLGDLDFATFKTVALPLIILGLAAWGSGLFLIQSSRD
jgi:hypothetical protein